MTQEVSKAINNLSKRLNDVERKLEGFLLSKHEDNVTAISDTEDAIMELAEMIASTSDEEV